MTKLERGLIIINNECINRISHINKNTPYADIYYDFDTDEVDDDQGRHKQNLICEQIEIRDRKIKKLKEKELKYKINKEKNAKS